MRSVAPDAAVAARANSVSEVLMAVKSGVGLAPLPVPFAAGDNSLVMVVRPRPKLTYPFYLVIHRNMTLVRRVRAFLDFITAERNSVRRVLSGEAAPTKK
jgi:DNA-binding transcriptional LysR family regulator